jgi:hypothetical protein
MKILLEFLESLGLGICLVLAAPLSFFRRLDHLFQLADHAGYLMRQRLFAALLRARLDYRMGNYQQSVVLLGPVVQHLEHKIKSDKALPLKIRRLLCTLYSDMQTLYLLSGQVEEAVQVVIRAQQNLGIDRLPTNPDLDIRTAHVIRAGLAASKLLEDGGLATLMVRQGEEPIVSRSPAKEPRGKSAPRPQAQAMKSEGRGATIIEFPKPTL